MRKDAKWGGNIELQAASLTFNVNIIVHQLDLPRLEIMNFDNKSRTIHLRFRF